MDLSGLFGIERGSDGLLRAIGPEGHRAKIGVRDGVAFRLAMSFQPDSGELAWMLANGDRNEAFNDAFQFTVAWDRLAPGEVHMAFMQDYPEIETLSLPGVVSIACSDDGMFHMFDVATGEASSVGVGAEVVAEIIKSWGGLEGAAEHAREFKYVGSLATILFERWDFEASIRGAVS